MPLVLQKARGKCLVASANVAFCTRERERLKATLRRREGESSAALGEAELRASVWSRCIAALRARHGALRAFCDERRAGEESRAERRDADEAHLCLSQRPTTVYIDLYIYTCFGA